ncbi:ROK family protein [candidate division TA06 bacterium]|uniref:ROK family protein n=1 Tax=candidate division TA06 bacterium TaxID=2250710 RepID=A0A933MJ61_UNCT6|nr:ROK family protein [candidate division TA06 bacterium]
MKSVLLGLDLGGTNIKGVLLDAKTLKPVHRLQVPTSARRGARAVIGTMAAAIRKLVGWAAANKMSVRAIGIGSAGLVNRGTVRNSPNLPGWQDAVPLEQLLKNELKGLNVPLAIDNDANCFVLAETFCGAVKGYQDVVGLTLGTGVGGGIVLGGKLYRGFTGGAGELGHVSIKYDGPSCLCGNKGCLEAMVGAGAIVRRYRFLNSKFKIQNSKFTVVEISVRAKRGEVAAVKALAETGILLGVGLANYVNIFNPQAIVIGGGVAQAGKYIMKPVVREMKQRAMPYNALGVKVKLARLGPWAGAIGAALLNTPGVIPK